MKGDSCYRKVQHTAQEVFHDTNSFRFQKVFLYQNSDILERGSKPKISQNSGFIKNNSAFQIVTKGIVSRNVRFKPVPVLEQYPSWCPPVNL